jgi:hypothetical protein
LSRPPDQVLPPAASSNPTSGDLAEVARVPAERPAPEPPRIVDQEEHELEGVGRLTKSSTVAVASATVTFRESSARRKRA